MVAFIERVSSEILTQIFEHCKDQAYENTKSCLFCLSHVCRFWKSVVHISPTLWSDIWLDVSTSMVVEQATYWLKRAGQTQPSITVVFPLYDESDDDDVWRGFIGAGDESTDALLVRLAGIVGGVMHRWKKFARGPAVPQQLRRLHPESLPPQHRAPLGFQLPR
ncbi:hypothetical protein BOTBODRAFT_224862 [Botryobasidium botryosum FD-172 SS1]|uniref:Uncharacterized protein n=1 Tax=Botryobasidium botryosum (strain FD-172 SS1) TaxID=930990 RepID=A0A067MZY7_BOTB1|nr:hypothetical protein BOTBODRAFT_224862 [Botryobasidium botryosum FD-172 SS1]